MDPEDLILMVSSYFLISTNELRNSRRQDRLVKARRIAAKLLREDLGLSLTVVGGLLRKDHTTIMQAVDDPRLDNEWLPDVQKLSERMKKHMRDNENMCPHCGQFIPEERKRNAEIA